MMIPENENIDLSSRDSYLDRPDSESEQANNQQPLTTQGSEEELEENLGGTTNLSLDQLKKEHDPEGNSGE